LINLGTFEKKEPKILLIIVAVFSLLFHTIVKIP